MRVITGNARGKKLKTLDNMDVRPTSDMVKEAIFSIVQFDVSGSVVLDLFSGSGQLGIEALSRGASHATFIDMSKASIDITKENIASTEMGDKARVMCMDSLAFLKQTTSNFDIAFLDPPYHKSLIEKVMPALSERMNDNGIVVCEHETGLVLKDNFGKLKIKKRYKYGKISLTVYTVSED